MMSQEGVSALKNIFIERFSLNNMEELVLALDIDFENLPGSTKSAKALALVEYLNRHRLMHRLRAVGSKMRPDVDWAAILSPPPPVGTGVAVAKLANIAPTIMMSQEGVSALTNVFIRHFNLDELHDLVFDLGLNFEQIPGSNLPAKALALAEYLNRHRLMDRLLAIVLEKRPDVLWKDIFGNNFDTTPQGVFNGADLAALAQVVAGLPDFATPVDRQAMLITAGLSAFAAGIDLLGPERSVSLRVVTALSEVSTTADGQTPLGKFLRYVMTLPESFPHEELLEGLIAKYRL
jgi:hypothetical protein